MNGDNAIDINNFNTNYKDKYICKNIILEN